MILKLQYDQLMRKRTNDRKVTVHTLQVLTVTGFAHFKIAFGNGANPYILFYTFLRSAQQVRRAV